MYWILDLQFSRVIKSLNVEKGPEFTLKLTKPETELTADLLIGWDDWY